MNGTVIFVVFSVIAVMGVFALHCRTYSRNTCKTVFGGVFSKK